MTDKLRAGLGCMAPVAFLLTPALTCAQNCALCYTQAAGSGSRMIAALRSGILILAIPPTLICCGIAWMAYKKRNQSTKTSTTTLPTPPPPAPELVFFGARRLACPELRTVAALSTNSNWLPNDFERPSALYLRLPEGPTIFHSPSALTCLAGPHSIRHQCANLGTPGIAACPKCPHSRASSACGIISLSDSAL